MNLLAEIAPHIYYVGANDRKTHKFEALWPLPYGVSYNSYLIVDEKVALIDTIEASCTETYLDNIQKILNGRTIDYLVINRMEPDHSASIAAVKRAYPQIEIVGNAKTLDMVKGFYGITDNTITMKEGDSLCLGSKELVFYLIPMVHWPETMVSYCPQEKILFSGDAFGCFGALEGGIVDTQLDCEIYWDEMVRYYANIVGKYGAPVQKALSKLSGVPLEMICSTHGPVWKENIAKVIGIYDKLSRYEAEEGVVIAYGSMYGHTAQMAEEIAKELAANGIKNIAMHDVSVSDKSYILRDIFRYKALIIGSPTYNTLLFPDVELLVSALRNREIKSRIFGCFGSYSWACRSVKELTAFGEQMHWDMPGCPVEMKQGGNDESMQQCRELAKAIAAKLQMA